MIFAFYAAGILILAYMALFHIKETQYFAEEEGVVVPKHVIEEHAQDGSEIAQESTGDATIYQLQVKGKDAQA